MRKVKYKVVNLYGQSITTNNKCLHLYYQKNTIVKASITTLGIFVFQTRKQAKKFIIKNKFLGIAKIKRVIPIGRGKTPKEISFMTNNLLNNFYKYHMYFTSDIPEGTICYPAVKVLD